MKPQFVRYLLTLIGLIALALLSFMLGRLSGADQTGVPPSTSIQPINLNLWSYPGAILCQSGSGGVGGGSASTLHELFPGGRFIGLSTTQTVAFSSSRSNTLQLRTPDPLSKVYAFYAQKFKLPAVMGTTFHPLSGSSGRQGANGLPEEIQVENTAPAPADPSAGFSSLITCSNGPNLLVILLNQNDKKKPTSIKLMSINAPSYSTTVKQNPPMLPGMHP